MAAWPGSHLRARPASAPEKGARRQGRQGQGAEEAGGGRHARPRTARCRNGPRPRSKRRSAASRPPMPRRRPSSSTSIRSRCWSRWCCRRRRPTPASTRRRRLCSPPPTRRRRWSARRGAGCAIYIKTIGLFRTKAKNVVALSQQLIARAWRQGAARRARRWRRCPASAARPPMSCSTSPSASRPSRSTPTSSASATAPGSPRQDAVRGREEAQRGGARQIQAARPPLADPARPLHLRRAPPAVRAMPHRRPVQMAWEDGAGGDGIPAACSVSSPLGERSRASRARG